VKLALVTGGLKRIGASIAARLASEGWSLALHSRKNMAADHHVAADLARMGTHWQVFTADLAEQDAPARLIEQVTSHFGAPPSLLVNNASKFVQDDWRDMTADGLADRLSINFAAPVMLSLAVARTSGPENPGCIINILDQRILQPNQDQLSYTLGKQGLAAATETLARVLAPHVRVNAVAPGLTIPTDEYRPAQMVSLEEMMPLKALPEPDDISDAVLWLVNARASTGQTIFVDGGASMRSYDRDFMFMAQDPQSDGD
jgi:pteridine reductase